MYEMHQFINRKAKFATGLIQYPSGKFGIVGSVPMELTYEGKGSWGEPMRKSMVWDTRDEAHQALTNLGYSTKDGLNYSQEAR